jgi:ribosome-binding protein aMBF1 (putative translation factor)
MSECFKCGVSGEKARLYDAISNRGLIKICADCASREDIPIVKHPTEEQITESKTPGSKSVRDRLKNMQKHDFFIGKEPTLRDLVDKKFKTNTFQTPSDLIPNFHWTIQQIRRVRKITREQFAKGIGESEATIRMVEEGILPNGDYKIINKIESYLGITLRKASSQSAVAQPRRYSLDNSLIEKERKEELPKKLSFTIPASRELKIGDLKNMKKQESEKKTEGKSVDSLEDEYSQDDEKFLDEQEDFDEDD